MQHQTRLLALAFAVVIASVATRCDAAIFVKQYDGNDCTGTLQQRNAKTDVCISDATSGATTWFYATCNTSLATVRHYPNSSCSGTPVFSYMLVPKTCGSLGLGSVLLTCAAAPLSAGAAGFIVLALIVAFTL